VRRVSALPAILAAAMAATPASAASDAAGFAYLRDIAPTIMQDIRYAGAHNFVGRQIDGYGAAECLLVRAAALALARVAASLRGRGYGLIVWDCYRPARAVEQFVRWTTAKQDARMRAEFYPSLEKSELIAQGYIAVRSSHSRGSAVDLGLRRLDAALPARWREGDALAPCTAPKGVRFEDGTVDLGTGFDCFDPSARFAASVGAAAQANRAFLRAAMLEEGFAPYAGEWWHFALAQEPFPRRAFDFPIGAHADPKP
jgi:D-alanyl-D-alanine dipeptidase